MKAQKHLMVAIALIFALLTNGSTLALAQESRQEKPQKRVERDVIIMQDGHVISGHGPVGEHGPFPAEIVVGGPGDDFTFTFLSSEMSFDSKLVKGAPYSAEAVNESTQTLADGNRIVRKTTSSVHRDGEGRTRREHAVGAIGAWAAAGDPPQTIFINDPVAGVDYVLDPRSRTARKLMPRRFRVAPGEAPSGGVSSAGAPKSAIQGGVLNGKAENRVNPIYPAVAKAAGAQGTVKVQIVINEAGEVTSAKAVEGHPLLQSSAVEAARQWRFKPTKLSNAPVKVTGILSFNFVLPDKGDDAKGIEPAVAARKRKGVTEQLGKQMIEGIEAEGTRTTTTIPANEIGNERPIEIVSERWYSPELQVVVMTRRNDPRFGETVYKLTNINRNEPARSLFEVPADYTIKEGPGTRSFQMELHRGPERSRKFDEEK